MKKEYKVNGKVTYPQGMASRTTYTLIDDVGNMINLNADIDTEFDYGDAVIMTITKKNRVKADTSEAPTTVDTVTGSVTTDNTATTDTTSDTASTDTAKPDATTTADTTDTGTQTAPTAATETEAK